MTPATGQLRLPLETAGPVYPGADPPPLAAPAPPPAGIGIVIEGAEVSPGVAYVRNPRARRYVLRVREDGSARVTIPRGGSAREAEAFLRRQAAWLARQRERMRARRDDRVPDDMAGDHVWMRGVRTALVRVGTPPHATLRFADQTVPLTTPDASPRTVLVSHLRDLAARELPARVLSLAAGLGLRVPRVAVRDQRSRWGSCSVKGAINLNWRLVQMPDEVRDYVMLHELMHLRRLDHSRSFWKLVASVCPWHREARLWLRRHGRELL